MSKSSKSSKAVTTAVLVPIDALRPNPWNPNAQSEFMFAKERQSIREFGFIDPITARRGRVESDPFPLLEIVDGEHRWRAAQLEGLTEVSVIDLGFMSDARAKTLTDVLNSLSGKNDEQRWAEMVASIQADDADLLQLLPYDEKELLARLELSPVDWNALGVGQEPRDLDSAGDGDGTKLEAFTLQLTAADAVYCRAVLRELVAAGLADSEAGALRLALEQAQRDIP